MTRAGLVLAFAAAVAASPPARAQDLEYPVKAVFLYKFAAFVDWPASAFDGPASPINLCIVGFDPFGASIDRAIRGQHIGDRPIVAHRLDRADPDAGCHIAYVAGSKAQSVADGVAALRGSPVLIVTDQEMGSARGIIHFAIRDDHVRFYIDDAAAAMNGLAISSKLLRLALRVRMRKEGEG